MSDENTDGPVVSVEDKEPAGAIEDPTDPVVAKVTVKNPAYPDGTELEVPGLGLVKNGETRDVTFLQARHYEIGTGKVWPMKDGKAEDLVIDFKTKEVTE